ncbi:MAG: DUF4783 domain-containing protein [Bacteroidota bacterium]|nr:DUF4783 domain-containing protein [Bacteroidota bacterium]
MKTIKNMNFRRKTSLSLIAFLLIFGLSSFLGLLQTADKIANAIKKGDAKSLATHFNKSVELVILDKENIYSKEQAELIMSSFFKKYPPADYEVQHNGGPDEAKYCIGIYKSGKIKFRVYYLIKTTNNKSFIHLFRIEKE